MTIIGDTSRFAIEYELDDLYEGVWLYGKVCFWICSQRVGDYDLGTSLRNFLFQIEQRHKDYGRRRSLRFDSMPSKAVFETIDEALYGGENSDDVSLAIEEEWGRHQLSPDVDVFDQWKIILVETEVNARLIYCCLDAPGDVRECLLLPGECDCILEQACQQIGILYKEELKKIEST